MNNKVQTLLDISSTHGREMYILGLKHAIEIIKILGDDAAKHLQSQVEQEEKELGNDPRQV